MASTRCSNALCIMSLTVGGMLLHPGPDALAAGSSGVGVGAYGTFNATDSSPSSSKSVSGGSYELGLSAILGALHLSVFQSRIAYTRMSKHDDNSKTDLKLRDSLLGFSARFVGDFFSLRVGRASHAMSSSEKTDGVDTGRNPLPQGKGDGWYYGGGIWVNTGADFAVILDFTRYPLPSSGYHVHEFALGLGYSLATAGSGASK